MNMKRLITLVAFFATLHASAQQVNPVPDYVFANRMSAGRNTVTDTAAYFSIGPRYGATRGMMPPMVVDTASFSANKRNGLLIFSVQKNKFLYWDSVGAKWAEMAGTAGTALTSADTAALLSTRAWRQKGIDSLAAIRIGGTGTTNYVPKFTASSTIGDSQIFDNGSFVGVNTSTSAGYRFDINGTLRAQGGSSLTTAVFSNTGFDGGIGVANTGTLAANRTAQLRLFNGTTIFGANDRTYQIINIGESSTAAALLFQYYNGSTYNERVRLNSNGEFTIAAGTTDAGDYKLQVSGNIYNTGNAILGANGGFVGINTVTTNSRLTIFESLGNAAITLRGRDDAGQPTTPVAVGYIEGRNALHNFVGSAIKMGASKTAGRIEFLASRNGTLTPYATIDTTGNFFISEGDNQWGTEKLDVNGRVRIRTIDSTSSNMNILYSDANGVIKKSGNIETSGTITTGAPSGGSIKPWKIGEAATVSPTSPNRTLRVEVDGVVYYIHAKTTND